MLVKTIKDYKDKETKLVFRTTDNCIIREVSDERGAELIAKGVVEEVKIEAKTKSKSKKKEEEVAADVETVEEEAVEETEETSEEPSEPAEVEDAE